MKLQKYGVRGLAFDFFQNYLNHRKHYTVINGRKSIYNYSNCGIPVPQGSILRPLLFIIYMNDLPAVSNFRTRLFADDTSLTISNKSSKTFQQVVNHEIIKVADWMSLSKLSINYNKTGFLLICNKKQNFTLKLTINDHIITQKKETEYLGILIDDSLSRKAHINLVYRKIAKGCFALTKSRNLVNLCTLKNVSYSVVYSHLQYCIIVWGQASKCVLDPIEKLHKRIVRIMIRQPFFTPSLPLFHQLSFLKISDIFKLEVTKLMLIAGESLDKPQFHSIKPIIAQHNYNTRHSVKNN